MTPYSAKQIRAIADGHYEHPWWPCFPRFHFYTRDELADEKTPWWWNNRITNWIGRFFYSLADYVWCDVICEYLIDEWNWMREVSPSFPEAFGRVFHNVFLFLTPWYRVRRRFMCAWFNENGSKLLNDGLDFAHVRTRTDPMTYYTLKFNGYHYKLTSRILRDKDGNASSAFLTGISIAFSDKSDEEKQKELDSYHDENKVICSGWIFTYEQAARELNRVAELTPGMEWFNPVDWKDKEEESSSSELTNQGFSNKMVNNN